MKKLIFVLFSLVFFSSYSYEIFELKIAAKADSLSLAEAIQYPAKTQANTFPVGIDVSFEDRLSGENRAIWAVENNSGSDLTNLVVLSYIDIEIEETTNTFFNETATLSSLSLPDSPTIINGYLPQAANDWMVDEPGYGQGNLLKSYNDFSLSNKNELGVTADDIAVLFAHKITEVKAGDAVYIEVRIADSDSKGILQADATSSQSYYINSIVYTKNLKSSMPPVVTITAPTTTSTVEITDTTIKVTDDAGILVADVMVDASTTAGYRDLNCTQTSATEVNCTVVITSGGDLVVLATDGDGLTDSDIATYNISAVISSNPPVVVITAPTTTSTADITDTTIKVTDDVGILAADVVVDGRTSIVYDGFSCVQTSVTEVNCVITIRSTGELIIKGTDSDGLVASDSASYQILTTTVNHGDIKQIPTTALWSLFVLVVAFVLVFLKGGKMKSRYFSVIAVLLIVTLVLPNAALASSIDNRGKDFWVSFMKNYNNAGVAKLFAAAAGDGVVTVEVGSINYKEDFNIIAGTVTPIILPDEVMLDGAGFKFETGIHVTADVDIALYGISQLQYTTDAFQAIPVPRLGTTYYLAGYTKIASMPPEFAVIATEDNTVIEFEFNELSKLEGKNPAFTQQLNRGDIYYFEYAVEDITGTKVTSSKPVSVFSGNNCVYIPQDKGACDHIVEQVPDISRWGQDFLLAPLALRKNGDTVRVLAQADDTEVYVNYSHLYTLSEGEFYEFIATEASYIKTSKPALVVQYSNGQQFDNVQADPFMMLVSPVNQYTNDYLIATPSGSFADSGGGKNFVNVLIHNAEKDSLLLDGQAVDPAEFQQITNSEYVYAQLPINDGQHTLTADIAFGLSVYGFATFESYGYPGGATYMDSSVTISPDSCLSQFSVRNKPGKVQLSWANSGAHTYQINRSNTFDGSYSLIANNQTNELTYLDTATLDQTNYYYQVTQLDELGIPRCQSARTIGYTPNFGKTFNLPPVIVSTPPSRTKIREPFNYQVVASDLESSTLTYDLLIAPATNIAATLDSAGLLSWQAEAPGEYSFAIEVTDDAGAKVLQEFILNTYDPNQLPVISSQPILGGSSNELYQYQVIATDPDGDALTYGIRASNNSIKIDADGLVSWQVPAGIQGLYPIEITVTDSHGASVKQRYSLYINKDLAPKFTSKAIVEGITGQPYSYQVTAEDPEGAKVKFYFPHGAPEGMTLDADTGLITWVSPIAGNYTMSIYATDGVSTTEQRFTLTIRDAASKTLEITSTPINTGEAATPYQYQVTVDHAYSTPKYSLRVNNDAAPITIDENSGLVSWVYPVAGNYTVYITVNDGKQIVTQNYSLYIARSTSTNTLPPEIISTPSTVHQTGTRYYYNVTATDPEGQTLTYALESGPVGMEIRGRQIFWDTPIVGTYSVSVSVNDGGFIVTQSYTLTVIEPQTVNQPPVITTTPPTTDTRLQPNQSFTYQVVATDADNDTLTYYLDGGSPPNGMTIDSITGLINWSGSAEIKNYYISVAVSDGKSITYQKFWLYVQAVTNRAPVFDSRPPTTGVTEGGTYRYDADATDPEGQTVTYYFEGSVPANMTINSQTGLVEWQNAIIGSYTVAIIATDGINQAKQTFTFSVGSYSQFAPKITSTPVTTGKVDEVYSYQVTATDQDNNTLTYALDTAPNGMSIDAASGLIDWVSPVAGTYPVVVSVNDGFYTTTQSYTLVVSTKDGNQPPEITSIFPTSVMAGNNYSYQVQANDNENDALSYRLDNAPSAMTVSASGLISWATTSADVGNYSLAVVVSDGQSETSQVINIEVRAVKPIPAELIKGVDWLKSQQQSDGTIYSDYTLATPYQTTDEAFRAAQMIGQSVTDNAIRDYLNNAEIYTTEHYARRAVYQVENSISYSNALNSVYTHYNQGLSAYTDFSDGDVNVVDTAYALLMQTKTSKDTTQVSAAIGYLLSVQNNDGSFAMTNNKADYYVTSLTLRTLVAYKNSYNLTDAITRARNYLMQNYASESEIWKKAHALITLYDALPDKAVLATQVESLKTLQSSQGFWASRDVFSTALAIQAIYLFEQ